MKKTTLFGVLKDIFSIKSGKLNECFNFNSAITNHYLLQRWVSMESPESALIVNATTNKLWKGLDDNKEIWYKLFVSLLRRKNFSKINYIKKTERTINEKKGEEIEEEAIKNQISKREVVEYWDLIDKIK